MFANLSKQEIKQIILNILKSMKMSVKDIILFGSRARGDNKYNSDWDILIIIKQKISFNKKREIARSIRKKLADSYVDADIIVKCQKEINYYKNFIGSVVREALKDGVTL
ncbi:MAG: nucleotidyltransferase domain-containing protein [Candidatus Goldbacteria bacterium]|nr:nucleotidyltransferase domain-containing protein [Candidatus Goldiibacteriota bacterium]